MAKNSLWGGVDIPVIGVTGEYSSGKSLFVSTIDPKNTLVLDFEKSLHAARGLGFKHIDVPSECLSAFGSGYSPIQVFQFFLNIVTTVEPGRYSVIATDPISDVESGMVEWVKSRYREFGFSSADKFLSTGGIFWGTVRDEWKRILASLTSKCQTFAFTTHLKTVWKHGRPTEAKAPKGKSTLMELASLALYLERGKDQEVPSANVLKTRLVTTRFDEETGECVIRSILPPRLDRATPKRIREYIINPPDYDNLSENEKEIVKELTDAQKLEMQLQIAETDRAAREAALEAARIEAKARDNMAPPPAPVDAPVDEGSDGGQLDCPKTYDELVCDCSTEDEKKAIGRKIYSALRARGCDVSGFTSLESASTYYEKLSDAEKKSLTS